MISNNVPSLHVPSLLSDWRRIGDGREKRDVSLFETAQADAQGPHETIIRAGEERILGRRWE